MIATCDKHCPGLIISKKVRKIVGRFTRNATRYGLVCSMMRARYPLPGHVPQEACEGTGPELVRVARAPESCSRLLNDAKNPKAHGRALVRFGPGLANCNAQQEAGVMMME